MIFFAFVFGTWFVASLFVTSVICAGAILGRGMPARPAVTLAVAYAM